MCHSVLSAHTYEATQSPQEPNEMGTVITPHFPHGDTEVQGG